MTKTCQKVWTWNSSELILEVLTIAQYWFTIKAIQNFQPAETFDKKVDDNDEGKYTPTDGDNNDGEGKNNPIDDDNNDGIGKTNPIDQRWQWGKNNPFDDDNNEGNLRWWWAYSFGLSGVAYQGNREVTLTNKTNIIIFH